MVVPKERAKRSEVALRAGVSEATVSFAFSKKRYVSEDLTARVLQAAEELDYQPDLIARSMVTKTTETIAVLTNDMASPLQMQIIKAIQSEAMQKGFFVNVCGGTSNLESYIDNFIARRVDGVFLAVVSSYVSDNCVKKMLDRGISVIVDSARQIDDDRVCGLELDFAEGMRIIVEYLKDLRHRRIVYLSCFDDDYTADKRLKGFRDEMGRAFPGTEPLIECGEPPYESTIEIGHLLMERFLARKIPFTAVVCANDLMAMGATVALREHDLRIPEDVSVVGIDDVLFSKAFYPPLTTLSHETQEYGRKIFEILHANILDKSVVGREVVSPKLLVRKSTASAGGRNGDEI